MQIQLEISLYTYIGGKEIAYKPLSQDDEEDWYTDTGGETVRERIRRLSTR